MKLENLDTSRFLYDPKNRQSYMRLTRYQEFKKEPLGVSIDRIIQYVILMYDPANVVIEQQFPYLPQRKMEVAKLTGLIWRGKPLTEGVEDMLIGKSPQVNGMIMRYLQLFNNPDIEMLAAYKEIFAALNKAVFSGDMETKMYNSLISNIERVNGLITSLMDRILNGKDETRLRADLYMSVEGHGLGVRPEDIAEKLKRGEEPFPDINPYGDYKPDKLKFIGDK